MTVESQPKNRGYSLNKSVLSSELERERTISLEGRAVRRLLDEAREEIEPSLKDGTLSISALHRILQKSAGMKNGYRSFHDVFVRWIRDCGISMKKGGTLAAKGKSAAPAPTTTRPPATPSSPFPNFGKSPAERRLDERVAGDPPPIKR